MNLLTEEDLKDLTGAAQAARQMQVLESNGIYYITRMDGSIVTTWHHVNHPCSIARPSNDAPNFSAIG